MVAPPGFRRTCSIVKPVAQKWRQRLGLPPDEKWERVRAKLSPLPVKDGVYLAHENCPQTYTARNFDHPSMLAAYGVLDGEGVDRETMLRTLHKVLREWRWADTWGVAEEHVASERPQLAARRPPALSARQRRAAHRRGDDGVFPRRFPEERLDGALGRPAPALITRYPNTRRTPPPRPRPAGAPGRR